MYEDPQLRTSPSQYEMEIGIPQLRTSPSRSPRRGVQDEPRQPPRSLVMFVHLDDKVKPPVS